MITVTPFLAAAKRGWADTWQILRKLYVLF